MRFFTFILIIIISSCTRLHIKKYCLINEKPIGFSTDKDSISNLTRINNVDLDDSKQSYYLINQQFFDSLILEFYQHKLFAYRGFTYSEEKTFKFYKFLTTNFKGKKDNKTKYFHSLKNNYYISLSYDYKDNVYSFIFRETNMYNAFIFHCGTHRRIYFWKNSYSQLNKQIREKKKNKIKEKLNITLVGCMDDDNFKRGTLIPATSLTNLFRKF